MDWNQQARIEHDRQVINGETSASAEIVRPWGEQLVQTLPHDHLSGRLAPQGTRCWCPSDECSVAVAVYEERLLTAIRRHGAIAILDILMARKAEGVHEAMEARRVSPHLPPCSPSCQSAFKVDPESACNIDPPGSWMEVVPVVHRGDPRGFA